VPDDSPLWLNAGDILIQRGNTIEYVGVPAIYKGMSKEFIYPDLMMKIRVTSQTNSDYLTFAISDTRARSHMRSRAVGAAGSMPKINHSILKSLPIPVCPLKEQEEIVRILNRSFSVIEKNSVDLDNQILRAEALRQSILKRAFAGELVPQDPSEEPAAALLARVRAECAVSAAPKTKSKKTRAAKA
jgi:type I restriction enzyme S subunit